MISRILVAISSVLGLGLWLRLTFAFAPGDPERLHALLSSLSLTGKAWLAYSFIVPAVYYLFTLLCSVGIVPFRTMKRFGVQIHILALPAFAALYSKFPTVTGNAIITAFFWFSLYRERIDALHIGQPDAAPNGGPATPCVKSEVNEGPPSVS
jgi:hypothetical protein